MSGEQRRSEVPQGPPWSVDLLADLHAGLLDDTTAEQLRQKVASDPDARDVMAALDATSVDLAELPPLEIPQDVAARIDTALDNEVRAWSQEQQAPAAPAANNVVDLASKRRRRYRSGAGLLAAAAAITGIVVVAPMMMTSDETGSDAGNQAAPQQPIPHQPTSGTPPMALQGGPSDDLTLNEDQFAAAFGSEQYLGALSDPADLVACLQANGVSSGNPMGALEVTINGRPAQLFILPSGELGQFRLLTVGADCGPDNPDTISSGIYGG